MPRTVPQDKEISDSKTSIVLRWEMLLYMSFLRYKMKGLEEEVDMCVARLSERFTQITHLSNKDHINPLHVNRRRSK